MSGSSAQSRVALATAVLGMLREQSEPWCLLHPVPGYPGDVSSDIDVIVSRSLWDDLPRLLAALPNARLAQCRHYESTARTLIIWNEAGGTDVLVAIDSAYDVRMQGRVHVSGERVLRDTVIDEQGNPVAAPGIQAALYVARRIAKTRHAGASSLASASSVLSDAWNADPKAARQALSEILPSGSAVLTRVAESGSWEEFAEEAARTRHTLLRSRSLSGRMSDGIRYWPGEVLLRLRRVVRREGVSAAYYGPDGVGKSRVIDGTATRLSSLVNGMAVHHVRPNFGRPQTQPVNTRPHDSRPRDRFTSTVKLMLWWVDCAASWPGVVMTAEARGRFVVFDRYFDDLWIDHARHRYGGSARLARTVGAIVPSPDLTFVLEAPGGVVAARKGEISADAADDLRSRYRALVDLRGARIVDADRPVVAVVGDVTRLILEFLSSRTERRLRVGHG